MLAKKKKLIITVGINNLNLKILCAIEGKLMDASSSSKERNENRFSDDAINS